MKKLVLVVCNTGHSSQMVAARLSSRLGEEYEFVPRGALARIPTEQELSNAKLVLTPFDEADFKVKMKGDELSEYYIGWMKFFNDNKGKKIIAYGKESFERLYKLIPEYC